MSLRASDHVKQLTGLGVVPNRLLPEDHLATLSFKYFRLRLVLRSVWHQEQRSEQFQQWVEEHMQHEAKKNKFQSQKVYDWDSGFSDS